MTRKLEDLFNLPIEDSVEESEEDVSSEIKQELLKSTEILNSLSSLEKIDTALSTVSGLNSHDQDMEDIADKAIDSYEKLMNLGMNVSDAHAAKVFDSASTMLKTALEAKDAKVNRKLKTIELQLKKAKLDFDMNAKNQKGKSSSRDGNVFDRNELLRIIKSEKDDNDQSE